MKLLIKNYNKATSKRPNIKCGEIECKDRAELIARLLEYNAHKVDGTSCGEIADRMMRGEKFEVGFARYELEPCIKMYYFERNRETELLELTIWQNRMIAAGARYFRNVTTYDDGEEFIVACLFETSQRHADRWVEKQAEEEGVRLVINQP